MNSIFMIKLWFTKLSAEKKKMKIPKLPSAKVSPPHKCRAQLRSFAENGFITLAFDFNARKFKNGAQFQSFRVIQSYLFYCQLVYTLFVALSNKFRLINLKKTKFSVIQFKTTCRSQMGTTMQCVSSKRFAKTGSLPLLRCS